MNTLMTGESKANGKVDVDKDDQGDPCIPAQESIDATQQPIPVVRKQIQLFEELYECPPVIDFTEDLTEYANDDEMREKRISDLSDRLEWVNLMLKMTEAELELIAKAEEDLYKAGARD